MLHVNRRRGIRMVVLAAIVMQLLVVLVSPVLIPVGVAAIVGGVTGLRLLRRDADGAVLRLGLGFLVSLLVTFIAFLSGALGLLLPALLSSVLFGVAWRRMSRLAQDERTAWGISYRDRIAQRPEEHLRRVGPPAPPPSVGPDGAAAPDAVSSTPSDPDAWWDELD